MKDFSQKDTILIVDDIPTNIIILERILSDEYKVKTANSGKQALKILKSAPLPDLILLDITMPDMDGYEVCRRLKENPETKNIPVMFVTALDQELNEAIGFELGAVDYITKPVKPTVVKARIKTQLDLYNQNRILEEKVQERTAEIQETRLEIIRRLCIAAEYKDNDTGLHVIRMSKYCEQVALGYGLSLKEVELILNAAPMHDIGKIGIPDSILVKATNLNPQEWKLMQTYTSIGAQIIGEHSSELLKAARIAALTHHEKWNGKGYPKGLKGEEIPLIGRIVAIADVFDALTNKRPYKDPWPVEKALALIQEERGEHFDPKVVDAFLKNFAEILRIKEKYSEDEILNLD